MNALAIARSAWRRAIEAADRAELQRQQLRELVTRLERTEREAKNGANRPE